MCFFMCAHISFAVLGGIALSDLIIVPASWVTTQDKSVFGLVWISEKIMIYKYSTGKYAYVPDLLSLVLSVILVQTNYTFRCLTHNRGVSRADTGIIASSLACICGLNILVSFDHRDRFTATYSQWNVHVCGVFFFIVGFLCIHLIVALAYSQHAVIISNAGTYAWYRRTGYFVGDGVYLAATMAFLVCVCFQQVVNAILMEYVLLVLLVVLNTISLLLLQRLQCQESESYNSWPNMLL